MMKASEIITELNRLIAEHGDLETLFEYKDDLFEIEKLEKNDVVFLKAKDKSGPTPTPVFLIS